MLKKIISLLCIYALMFASPHVRAAESTGALTSATFTAQAITATIMPNPDRGWAGWSGADFVNSYDAGSVSANYSANRRLTYCQARLDAFKTTDISSQYLTDLQTRLNSIRSAGMKCVLRFSYNQSQTATDASEARILGHLDQLAPTLKANADVIPYMHAGFIGAWGEWHSSTNNLSCVGNNTPQPSCATAAIARRNIMNKIMASTHPLTLVQFRYPDDIAHWYSTPITSAQAYGGTKQSRMAAGNDCQFSGPNVGTEGTDTYTWNSNQNTGRSVTSLKTYVDSLSNYGPYGGETTDGCVAPLRTGCSVSSGIMADGKRWHMTHMRRNYSDSSIAGFVASWASCDTELTNSLGYRIVLNSISHQGTAVNGQTITASINMHNIGWSRVHHPRKVQIVMSRVGGGASDIVCDSRIDLRALPPQTSTASTVTVNCTTGIAGTWNVYVRMPDIWPNTKGTAAFAIRPANTDAGGASWDSTNFRWTTGTTIVVS